MLKITSFRMQCSRGQLGVRDSQTTDDDDASMSCWYSCVIRNCFCIDCAFAVLESVSLIDASSSTLTALMKLLDSFICLFASEDLSDIFCKQTNYRQLFIELIVAKLSACEKNVHRVIMAKLFEAALESLKAVLQWSYATDIERIDRALGRFFVPFKRLVNTRDPKAFARCLKGCTFQLFVRLLEETLVFLAVKLDAPHRVLRYPILAKENVLFLANILNRGFSENEQDREVQLILAMLLNRSLHYESPRLVDILALQQILEGEDQDEMIVRSPAQSELTGSVAVWIKSIWQLEDDSSLSPVQVIQLLMPNLDCQFMRVLVSSPVSNAELRTTVWSLANQLLILSHQEHVIEWPRYISNSPWNPAPSLHRMLPQCRCASDNHTDSAHTQLLTVIALCSSLSISRDCKEQIAALTFMQLLTRQCPFHCALAIVSSKDLFLCLMVNISHSMEVITSTMNAAHTVPHIAAPSTSSVVAAQTPSSSSISVPVAAITRISADETMYMHTLYGKLYQLLSITHSLTAFDQFQNNLKCIVPILVGVTSQLWSSVVLFDKHSLLQNASSTGVVQADGNSDDVPLAVGCEENSIEGESSSRGIRNTIFGLLVISTSLVCAIAELFHEGEASCTDNADKRIITDVVVRIVSKDISAVHKKNVDEKKVPSRRILSNIIDAYDLSVRIILTYSFEQIFLCSLSSPSPQPLEEAIVLARSLLSSVTRRENPVHKLLRRTQTNPVEEGCAHSDHTLHKNARMVLHVFAAAAYLVHYIHQQKGNPAYSEANQQQDACLLVSKVAPFILAVVQTYVRQLSDKEVQRHPGAGHLHSHAHQQLLPCAGCDRPMNTGSFVIASATVAMGLNVLSSALIGPMQDSLVVQLFSIRAIPIIMEVVFSWMMLSATCQRVYISKINEVIQMTARIREQAYTCPTLHTSAQEHYQAQAIVHELQTALLRPSKPDCCILGDGEIVQSALVFVAILSAVAPSPSALPPPSVASSTTPRAMTDNVQRGLERFPGITLQKIILLFSRLFVKTCRDPRWPCMVDYFYLKTQDVLGVIRSLGHDDEAEQAVELLMLNCFVAVVSYDKDTESPAIADSSKISGWPTVKPLCRCTLLCRVYDSRLLPYALSSEMLQTLVYLHTCVERGVLYQLEECIMSSNSATWMGRNESTPTGYCTCQQLSPGSTLQEPYKSLSELVLLCMQISKKLLAIVSTHAACSDILRTSETMFQWVLSREHMLFSLHNTTKKLLIRERDEHLAPNNAPFMEESDIMHPDFEAEDAFIRGVHQGLLDSYVHIFKSFLRTTDAPLSSADIYPMTFQMHALGVLLSSSGGFNAFLVMIDSSFTPLSSDAASTLDVPVSAPACQVQKESLEPQLFSKALQLLCEHVNSMQPPCSVNIRIAVLKSLENLALTVLSSCLYASTTPAVLLLVATCMKPHFSFSFSQQNRMTFVQLAMSSFLISSSSFTEMMTADSHPGRKEQELWHMCDALDVIKACVESSERAVLELFFHSSPPFFSCCKEFGPMYTAAVNSPNACFSSTVAAAISASIVDLFSAVAKFRIIDVYLKNCRVNQVRAMKEQKVGILRRHVSELSPSSSQDIADREIIGTSRNNTIISLRKEHTKNPNDCLYCIVVDSSILDTCCLLDSDILTSMLALPSRRVNESAFQYLFFLLAHYKMHLSTQTSPTSTPKCSADGATCCQAHVVISTELAEKVMSSVRSFLCRTTLDADNPPLAREEATRPALLFGIGAVEMILSALSPAERERLISCKNTIMWDLNCVESVMDKLHILSTVPLASSSYGNAFSYVPSDLLFSVQAYFARIICGHLANVDGNQLLDGRCLLRLLRVAFVLTPYLFLQTILPPTVPTAPGKSSSCVQDHFESLMASDGNIQKVLHTMHESVNTLQGSNRFLSCQLDELFEPLPLLSSSYAAQQQKVNCACLAVNTVLVVNAVVATFDYRFPAWACASRTHSSTEGRYSPTWTVFSFLEKQEVALLVLHFHLLALLIAQLRRSIAVSDTNTERTEIHICNADICICSSSDMYVVATLNDCAGLDYFNLSAINARNPSRKRPREDMEEDTTAFVPFHQQRKTQLLHHCLFQAEALSAKVKTIVLGRLSS